MWNRSIKRCLRNCSKGYLLHGNFSSPLLPLPPSITFKIQQIWSVRTHGRICSNIFTKCHSVCVSWVAEEEKEEGEEVTRSLEFLKYDPEKFSRENIFLCYFASSMNKLLLFIFLCISIFFPRFFVWSIQVIYGRRIQMTMILECGINYSGKYAYAFTTNY